MIPLEKQVTSLEPSKRLKELGVKQDSYWVWVHPFLAKDLEHFYDVDNKLWKLIPRQSLAPARVVRHIFAAFTVAELGEMLPDWADFTQKHYNSISKEAWYRCYTKTGITLIDDFKEADARARMRIYLIENKLMEANE